MIMCFLLVDNTLIVRGEKKKEKKEHTQHSRNQFNTLCFPEKDLQLADCK